MTTKTDVKTVTTALTANAKSSSIKAGADLTGIMLHIQLKTDELRLLIQQAINMTPSGDANLATLNSILAALA